MLVSWSRQRGAGFAGSVGCGYGWLLGTVGTPCWSQWDGCAVLIQGHASKTPLAPGGGLVDTAAAPVGAGVKGVHCSHASLLLKV